MPKREAHEEIESRLADQLLRVEKRIVKLVAEKENLQAAISANRAANLRNRPTLRENSFRKFHIEQAVIEYVSARKSPSKGAKIFDFVKSRFSELEPTTFRTYLYRMKSDGRIASTGRGYYRIP